VLSEAKSRRLWTLLLKFRVDADAKELVTLQNRVQEEMINSLRARNPDEMPYPNSEAVGAEPIDRIIHAHEAGDILVLIDIPTERSGARIPLEYLPEADRRDILQDWPNPIALDESVIWTNLHDAFLKAVGKVRLFCDPRFRDTFEAGLKKEKLAQIVEGVVRQLL
jgi:hypothetical protein